MGLYLVLCCLFPVAHTLFNPENLPQLYKPEGIKIVDGEKCMNIKRRKEQTKLARCSYHDGQFMCKDGLKCIDLMDTCNGDCNCWDCSDESDQCWKYDENLCRTCFHQCLPTPDGPQCFCDADDYKFCTVCKEISECSRDNRCEQNCVRYEGVERCSCGENYRGKPSTYGRSCISDVPYENVLLYSTNDKIKLFNSTSNKIFVVRDNVNCKGLSAAHDDFYYGVAEKSTGYVYKTSIVTGKTDLVIETYSPLIFSIDVDWITGNIYFSTDKSLGVCSKDGLLCALIKHLSVTDSCHISLAPRFGLLFHSLRSVYHWYQDSRIMKSSMDGSDEKVLVSEGLRHPMSLTVDELSQKVYWMDCDLGEIESIQFNGNNRKIWFSESRMHIFTISKFEGNIFWTEESKNTIGSNFEIKTKFMVDKNTTVVKYLYAYNSLLQHTEIRNPCAEESCTGLCLLRPSPSDGLNFTCLCEDYTPSNKKPWCNNNRSAHVNWQFETDFEYEIRPPQTQSEVARWLKDAFYIILGGFLMYGIFRRRTLYIYYDRVFNWNWDREEQIHLNEYEEL